MNYKGLGNYKGLMNYKVDPGEITYVRQNWGDVTFEYPCLYQFDEGVSSPMTCIECGVFYIAQPQRLYLTDNIDKFRFMKGELIARTFNEDAEVWEDIFGRDKHLKKWKIT